MARKFGPDPVTLDRELGQQLFFQRDAPDFFQQRLEVHGEEDVDAALELVGGQVPPAVEIADSGRVSPRPSSGSSSCLDF
jgi:hypothetical protein